MTRWTLWLAVLAGCAPDLAPDGAASDDTGPATVASTLDGVVHVTVDATDEVAWVPYAFVDGGPEDLAFQRYRVRLGQGVAVAWLDGVAFDAVIDLPEDGWTTDAEPLQADEDYALNVWYDYDPSSHTLAPADRVAVIERADGSAVKLAFDSYYDEAGTPGHVAFRWAWLGEAR